jgi:nucleotide-binding universal stress UspA family protein
MNTRPILVGYDGSDSATAAVDWALAQGLRTAAPVQLVHAFEWPMLPALPSVPQFWPDEIRQKAEQMVQDAAADAMRSCPGVDVTATVVDGPPAAVLREQSRSASVVVLGNRGHGAVAQLFIGSTSLAVAMHGHCPVVVVRGDRPPADAPVIVGVDGSPCSLVALRYAVEQAVARSVPLQAVRVWAPPSRPPAALDQQTALWAEKTALEETLKQWRRSFPTLLASARAVTGSPGRILVEASRDAQLVVVGSRGLGGFRGLLLGSVSQQLLLHSHCPVAVIR